MAGGFTTVAKAKAVYEADISALRKGALEAEAVVGRSTTGIGVNLEKVNQHTEKTGDSFKRMGEHVLKAGIAFVGLKTGIAAVESLVKAAEDAQVANELLAQQVKNVGVNFEQNQPRIEAFIKKLSDMSGFTRTDLTEAFTTLIRVTKDVGKAHEDLGIAVDLARLKHISLEAATNLVAKAQLGMVSGLKRMGIDVTAVTTNVDALRAAHDAAAKAAAAHGLKVDAISKSQLDAAKSADKQATATNALAKLHETAAGAAEKYGQTAAGAMDRFRAAVEELQVKLGSALLPELAKLSDKANKFVTEWDKAGTTANDFHNELQDVADSIKSVAGFANDAADAIGGWKTVIEGLIALKLASTISGWAGSLNTLIGTSGGATGGKGGVVGKGLKGATAESSLLKSQLSGLQTMGAITILIELILNKKSIDDFAKSHGFGWTTHGLIYYGKKVSDLIGGSGDGGFIPLDKNGNPPGGPSGPAGGAGAEAGAKAAHGAGVNASTPFKGPPGGGVVGTASAAASSPYAAASSFHLAGERQPYDCSAFTQAVFKQNKISIGGDTVAQYAGGRPVMQNDIQPGDLVFFQYPVDTKRPGHVGIATSATTMVHDHGQSGGVAAQAIDFSAYVGAKCYIASHTHAGAGGGAGGGGGGPTFATTPKATSASKAAAAPALPASLDSAISSAANKAQNATSPTLALTYLKEESDALEKARAYLKAHETKKNTAETEKAITEIDNKLRDVGKQIGDTQRAIADEAFIKNLPAKLRSFTQRLKTDAAKYDALVTKASYDTGQALLDDYTSIASNLADQSKTLIAERTKLQGMLKGADKTRREEINRRITDINSQLSKVHDEVKQNLQNTVTALQATVSQLSSQISTGFSTYVSAIDKIFESKTAQLIKDAGGRFFQGTLTPSEQALADRQAADQKKSVYDPLSAAQKKLKDDTWTLNDALANQTDLTQEQINAMKLQLLTDQQEIDAAQAAIEEYELQVKATAERTQADHDYADAVDKINKERGEAEDEMNAKLGEFGGHLADGSVNLADLNPLLAQFGLSTADVNAQTPLVASNFDDLKSKTKSLADAMADLRSAIDRVVGGSGGGSGGTASPFGGAPSPPKMGEGGIVTSPVLAWVGERGEREFVIPEHKIPAGQRSSIVPLLTGLIRGGGGAAAVNSVGLDKGGMAHNTGRTGRGLPSGTTINQYMSFRASEEVANVYSQRAAFAARHAFSG